MRLGGGAALSMPAAAAHCGMGDALPILRVLVCDCACLHSLLTLAGNQPGRGEFMTRLAALRLAAALLLVVALPAARGAATATAAAIPTRRRRHRCPLPGAPPNRCCPTPILAGDYVATASYSCDPTTCVAPKCLCAANHPPGGLTASQLPQFILVRFGMPTAVPSTVLADALGMLACMAGGSRPQPMSTWPQPMTHPAAFA